MRVIELLNDEQIKQITDYIGQCEFKDGMLSAQGQSRQVKQNLQITNTDPKILPLFKDIETVMKMHPLVSNYANIRNFVGMRVGLYEDGGHYGWHVDHAHMQQMRTDLSFTIFLTDSSEFEGGELEMDYGNRKVIVKGKKGHVVIYPTGVLHQVKPVTKGKRLCIIGWIESLVPRETDREAMINFFREINRLKEIKAPQESIDQLNYTLQYMKRRFSE